MPNFVCLTIRFKTPLVPYVSGRTINVASDETLNETLNETLKLIRNNPGIQRKELVVRTGLVPATISRHISMLMGKNLIERRGSKKNGGYYPL